MKRLKRFMVETRLRSIQRVRANAVEAGWPTVVEQCDDHIRRLRRDLSGLRAVK